MAKVTPTKGLPPQRKKWARLYETIYILRSNVTTEEAQKVSDRVVEVINKEDGKLTKVDNWGKRKMAYPIKKHTRGIFVYVGFLGYDGMIRELERNLRLLDQVLRFQTIVVEDAIDMSTYEVDAEEVKFIPIEETEDEPEPTTAERLGMVPRERTPREPRPEAKAADGEAADAAATDAPVAEAAPAADAPAEEAPKGDA